MSSDTVCEEIGSISVVGNKVLWIMSNFYDLEKNIRFKSPQFTLMNGIWQLRYCYFRSILTSKEWLDIGVKLLTIASTFKGKRVRFGITGNSVEISKTLEFNHFSKYCSLTLPYEDQMGTWVAEGNLCLFLAIEKVEDACLKEMILHETAQIGINNDSKVVLDRCMYEEASTQIEEFEIKESCRYADKNAVAEASSQTESTGEWKLPPDFEKFLLNGYASDLTIKVGEEEIKSHRCILAARSPIFSDFILQQMQEMNTAVLNIQDIDTNTFSIFHNYLYTGRVENITPDNAHNLYTAAVKYKMHELKNICLDHMLKNISAENFCDILALSRVNGEQDLFDACNQFFMNNYLNIITTSKWQTFLSENADVGNELYVKLLQKNK